MGEGSDGGRRDSNEVQRPSSAAAMRGQAVFVRRTSEVGAMGWGERFRAKSRYICRKLLCQNPNNADSLEQDVEDMNKDATRKQYRLEATRANAKSSWLHFLTCGLLGRERRGGMTIGINPNQQLAMYLHWMFRVNFLFLFCVMCVMFFVLVMVFAALIIMAGVMDDECVRIGGAPFGEVNSEFADAFALSWTTFSTVGYGSTYPALGAENDSPTNCFFITFICSLESLLGVLYSGFCGAILFGKVLRIQSHAQVIFSDPIVIRYGTGVAEGGDFDNNTSNNNASDDEGPSSKKKTKSHPCPVLEFRIVNRLFNEAGGEIMDATLNVVANVDANDADPSLIDALDSDRKRYNQSFGTATTTGQQQQQLGGHHSNSDMASTVSHGDTSESDHVYENGHLSPTANNLYASSTIHSSTHTNASALPFPKFLDPFHSLMGGGGKVDHQAIDEDPSARLVSKRIFSKMLIEASDHPFFKRVWLARHVLDETSPILKPRVRRQIRRNGGSWPERLCTWNAIRDSLQFNQILVSLNGVSNVSASDVYAQKIYDFVDINVGYQFVNILYKDTDGALKVDTDLINDVREQKGGGGEPLIIDES
ncbi:expressed unknown protein [Seminavis robusta]|uniref:Uncharacterized protein n=1 Tax=Seminavis robusta TaxID=568900 RepID=A0A9N8DHU8_9STRA|nr:expressed unknown protein [Seminavis robusta]|eukprot:Sro72_g040120.1 n/a (594) ;mRNA; f:126445-128674